jgi:hypothetical protein
VTRSRKPCGTTAAYWRHIRHGQPPCDECARAERDYKRARYVPRLRELQPCGTPAAARRHYRLGEPLDAACLRASRYSTGSAQPGLLAEDWRPVRNGIPESVPYVYGIPRPAWSLAALGRAAAIYGWPDDEEEAS